MALVWAASAVTTPNGKVEFTAKGHSAIKALFNALDKDNSGGISFEEFRDYVRCAENVTITEDDFATLDLKTTEKSEISLEGLEELYYAIFDANFPLGEKRLQNDLALYDLDHILKAKDVSALLMGATRNQNPREGEKTSKKAKGSRRQEKVQEFIPAHDRLTPTSCIEEQPEPNTSPSTTVSEIETKLDSSTDSVAVDLTSPRKTEGGVHSFLVEIKDTESAEPQTAETAKRLHPFFLQQRVGSRTLAGAKRPTNEDASVQKVEGLDEAKPTLESDQGHETSKRIHPFFLKRPRTGSLTQQQQLNQTVDVNDETPPLPSSFAGVLRTLQIGGDFPEVEENAPKVGQTHALLLPKGKQRSSISIDDREHMFRLDAVVYDDVLNRVDQRLASNTVMLVKSPIAKRVPSSGLVGQIDLSEGDAEEEGSSTMVPIDLEADDVNDTEESSGKHRRRMVVDDEEEISLVGSTADKQQSWPQRFTPKQGYEIAGNREAVSLIRSWLESLLMDRSRADSEREDESNSEYSNSDEEVSRKDSKAILVFGPSGSGKTSAIYAVAREMSFRVFEVSAGDDRSRIKAITGEASQSYGLSKSNRALEMPLILIDEFDTGFQDDPANYLASLRHIIRTSKAPVVLVCDDILPRSLSSNGYDLDQRNLPVAEVIRFERPSNVEFAKRIERIVPSISHVSATRLASAFKGDIRHALQNLHFYGNVGSLLDDKISNERTIEMNEDGLSNFLALTKPPQVHSINPGYFRESSEPFVLSGRFFSSDCLVDIGDYRCASVDVTSDVSLRACLAENAVNAQDSLDVPKENAKEDGKGDAESEIGDFEEELPPRFSDRKQKGQELEIFPSVVVKRRIRVQDLSNSKRHMDLELRSDDVVDQRFNSLYICMNKDSMSAAVSSGPDKEVGTFVKRDVNLEAAKANLGKLRQEWLLRDCRTLGDFVSRPRRTASDKKDDAFLAELYHSDLDYVGECFESALRGMESRGEELDEEVLRKAFLAGARRNYIVIDNQPSRALFEDVPFYIRMSRLDQMRRHSHVGRRRFTSHFAYNFDWLDCEKVAELGLQDTDLGYSSGKS